MKFPLESVYSWYRNTLRNPQYRWWIVGGTLVYLLSPFDILPDFFPIIGEIDDIAIVTLLFAEISQIVVEHLKQRQADSNVSETQGTETSTVEVNAVQMKE
jgi:uncharacterized membrane protein YkvA (DUF1232 family)